MDETLYFLIPQSLEYNYNEELCPYIFLKDVNKESCQIYLSLSYLLKNIIERNQNLDSILIREFSIKKKVSNGEGIREIDGYSEIKTGDYTIIVILEEKGRKSNVKKGKLQAISAMHYILDYLSDNKSGIFPNLKKNIIILGYLGYRTKEDKNIIEIAGKMKIRNNEILTDLYINNNICTLLYDFDTIISLVKNSNNRRSLEKNILDIVSNKCGNEEENNLDNNKKENLNNNL